MNKIDRFAEVVMAAYKRMGMEGEFIDFGIYLGKADMQLNTHQFEKASESKKLCYTGRGDCVDYPTAISYTTPSGCKVFCLSNEDVEA